MPHGPFYATTLMIISQHLVKSWMILLEFYTSHPNHKNLMMTPGQGMV